MTEFLTVIRGAGDLAGGVAHRLHRSGFKIIMTELSQPLVVRRAVAFAEAVYEGTAEVEGVAAVRVATADEALSFMDEGKIAVIVDPPGFILEELQPVVLIDAIMAKRNLGTRMDDAPITVALGPGFEAGRDVHAVVETRRGHNMGRVILKGCAEPDTGSPAPVLGVTEERLLRSPSAGTFRASLKIGDSVRAGQVVGHVDGHPVRVGTGGIIRGLLRSGLRVSAGLKIGDVDPRGDRESCFTISDKARSVGGGVLEAILYFASQRKH